MNVKTILIVVGVLVLLVIGYFVFFTQGASDETVENQTGTPTSSEVATETSQPTNQAQQEVAQQPASQNGAYISYADYQSSPGMYNDGTIVYFFNASWCPTCKVLDSDINESLSDIPVGTAIVSVDYDEYTDLKRQYGVTYQHTLVQVDAEGNQIKKWSGGNTLESVLEEV